jgi:5'-3' exonuclease
MDDAGAPRYSIAMKKGDHLFLVDGSGFIFRAFHALPPLTRKSDGLPVGAVSGFCNMLWKLLTDARDTSVGVTPTHFAVIFDYSAKTFRKDLYNAYKANRSEPPEDLIPQFGLIRQATRAFNLPCIETEGFEADDIIATYARQAEAIGADVTIISSDKDLMQLVTPNVHMYDSMKDKQIGIPEVIEKWGVPPEKMIDLQAMVGDSVDNVPGIPGIGPKTAAQLLEEFGDLDTLLARAAEIKQVKRRENIVANAELARLSRRLVELRTDAPLDMPLDALVLEPQNGPKLIGFLKAMEFGTLTRRVAEACDCDASAIEPAHVQVEWGAAARGPDLDAGTSSAEPRVATPAGGKAGTTDPYGNSTPAELAKARAEAFATAKIDKSCYVTIDDLEDLDDWLRSARETGLVAFEAEGTSIDPMLSDVVGISLALADNSRNASGLDVRAAYILSVYERLERPLVPVLVEHGAARHFGRPPDHPLSRLSGELAQGAARLEDEIYALAGERLNIGSPKQLGDILFGKMGLPGGSKTKTGQWSTSAQVLEDLAAEGHELPRKIVDWRQLTKLKSTYTDALPGYVHPETKRVHTSYALAATTTGRLSSSSRTCRTSRSAPLKAARSAPPSSPTRATSCLGRLQPDRTARARPCRRYPATAAGLCRRHRHPCDDGVRDVQRAGRGHAFGVRRRAKAINFGIIYGISAFGLANQLSIPREEASDYIKKLFRALPRHPRLHGQHQGVRARERLCRDDLRAARALSGNPVLQSAAARLQRARGDQRADPGIGRRHHPPRHGCAWTDALAGCEALCAHAAAGP